MIATAVFNNKGGVGKTTLLCNLAAYLAIKKNKRVLVVDADPQCNATTYFFPEETVIDLYEKKSGTINDIIRPLGKGRGYFDKDLPVIRSKDFKVDVLPGDPRLALSEDLLAADWISATSGNARGLQTTTAFLHLAKLCAKYDLVFFDVGPSLGAINRAVLLGCDFFLLPMSSDIFSLRAVENISLSLSGWRKGFENGLSKYKEDEDDDFEVDGEKCNWKLQFAGYITQQYTAKTVRNVRQPVNAYDRIIKKVPELIQTELVEKFSSNKTLQFKLGQIQNLHSLVPMSQLANVPIFQLRAQHGVVGAHFMKVRECEDIIAKTAERFLDNLTALQ